MAQASTHANVHHACYHGQAKTFPQHVLTAMAINLVRIDAWFLGAPVATSWTSCLTRLRQTLAPREFASKVLLG